LKKLLKAAGLEGAIRINKAGCLDQCEHRPVMVVYPEAVWYGHVRPEDVEEIVAEHLAAGRPVERLRLAGGCINTRECSHRIRETLGRETLG
jgi:(2Fe-2S) ferredoxin